MRQQERAGVPLPLPCSATLTPGQAVRLLLMHPAGRSPPQQAAVCQLRVLHPEIGTMAALREGFASLVRHPAECPEAQLADWMQAAMGSGIGEFRTFVARLQQDRAAVLAGLRLPWSQGESEGQILRLKLIRRQLDGRGTFDLVRKQVLGAA